MRRERTITIHGRSWTVYERLVELDRRRKGSLIFDSGEVLRRIRDYPEDWSDLSDAALIALCEATPPAHPVDRSREESP